MDDDAPSLRRERSWLSGRKTVIVGGVWVGTPAADVELRNVFDGEGAAPLEPDVSMFSGTTLTRTAAAGVLPPVPLWCSDVERVLLIIARRVRDVRRTTLLPLHVDSPSLVRYMRVAPTRRPLHRYVYCRPVVFVCRSIRAVLLFRHTEDGC